MFLEGAIRRMRAVLAAADERDHEQVVANLAGMRATRRLRMITAYLVPHRQDWVDECVAEWDGGHTAFAAAPWKLWCSVQSAEQAAHLGPIRMSEHHLDHYYTALEGVGAALAPMFVEACDEARHASSLRYPLEVLAIVPTDEAFLALAERADRPRVRPILAAAIERFPRRAARLLPTVASGAGGVAGELLDELYLSHPELAPEPPSRQRVPAAAAEDLPELLARPLWERERAAVQSVVIDGLVPPIGDAVAWEPGEREEWDEATPHMGNWARSRQRAARDELDAVPDLIREATRARAFGALLVPFLTPEVGALMAEWCLRGGQARTTAHDWLDRHRVAAALLLVPAALGPAGKRRRAAQTALLHIADREGGGSVVEAARVYGARAASAVEAVLAAEPFTLAPVRRPTIGRWADPVHLPQILLNGRVSALPDAATRTLLMSLALAPPKEWFTELRERCDAGSLAEFSWAVFERWRVHGSPSRDGWALGQLGILGDDEVARRITPLIRAWPLESRHRNAAAGLEVLAGIGTDVALMHLHGLSQKLRFKALKGQAQVKVAQVATELGLSRAELADRLVPDFGLDASGSMIVDYGPRCFTVGFDERLKPYVLDGTGKRRGALPKPGAKDDPELAPAAYKRFAALKKDVRAVAADQIVRLEDAMATRRRWSAPDFRRLLVEHPLMRHLVTRLVWSADDGWTFRVAEDGTFAGPGDDGCGVPETAWIRIAHRLDLDEVVDEWGRVFADYEIAQPFPQLDRQVHALTPTERETGDLTRFDGTVVPLGRLLALERRGWEHDEPADAGVVTGMFREVGGVTAWVNIDPPVAIGQRDPAEEVTISVGLHGDAASLHPIVESELLRELTAAAGTR